MQGRAWSENGSGGFAAFKNLYASEELPKLALDLGNWSSATREGRFTKGRVTADCVGALPYSAAAVGTEELSLSEEELKSLARTAGEVPLLASNLYLRNNRKPDFLRSWHVAEAGGRKIGVFAVVIGDPARPNRRKYYPAYKLEEEIYESERALNALKSAGAQVNIMLLGVNPDKKAGEDYFRDFISRLPRVDLVITDEPSVKKPFKVKRTWIAPAGSLAAPGRMLLTLDPASGRLKKLKYKAVASAAEKHGEDPAMLKVAAKHLQATSAYYGRKVGKLSAAVPLKAGTATPAADFAADCMRRWARTNAAVVGLDEAAAPLPGGPVTLGDLYASFPRESSVVFVKIRGDDLERALTTLYPSGIAVSGLRLHLRDGAVERVSTESGPLVPGRTYRLAVPDTLASGRDNPVLSSAMEFANSRRGLRDVIRWYFSLRSEQEAPEGGRILEAGEK